MFNKVPKKYHPAGFELLYEDIDLIVGNKAPGVLTVAAAWNKKETVESALNTYIRKGATKSSKSVFVVHRLDQDTSGVLVFAKNEAAFNFLKANWPTTVKTYLAVVHRPLKEKLGKTVHAAIVLHTGPRTYGLGDGVWAMPIASLWGTPR